ncbi:MAG: hypothetical protein L0H96_25080 [Humibacillus sp.]|nr:hypothetical protein [Humibacillus sp.]MDN5780156.1 hypothetical protein [Humibacillus sp.]
MTTGPSPARPAAGAAEQRVLRALARARSVTGGMSDELLTHVPDLGDLTAGRVLDAWVEQAADTLRALSEAMEERLLDTAAGSGATPSRPRDDVRP